MQNGLQRRLNKAEAALKKLTPAPGRGKQQIEDEPSLLEAIDKLEKLDRVQGFFDYPYHSQVKERPLRAYQDHPARIERQARYQLSVTRNQEAMAEAEFKAGWRIYATNAPTQKLSLTEAVLAYRDQ